MKLPASRKSRITEWLAFCLFLAIGFLTWPTTAWSGQVILVASDSAAVRTFAEELALRRPQDQVRFQPLEQAPVPATLPSDARLILFGEQALRWRMTLNRGPATLALLISRVQAQQLLGENRPASLSLLWSDPPIERQLQLVKLLMPSVKRIGIPYDTQSAFLLEEAQRAAEQLQLTVVPQRWADPRDTETLKQLLRTSDVLLGLDDQALYNPATAKSLLLTSYGQNRPLIGPSAAFVKAGSLASSYSDQQDWLETLDDLLDRPASAWPRESYPEHFKVAGNRQVARSLGIRIPDDLAMAQQLAEGARR